MNKRIDTIITQAVDYSQKLPHQVGGGMISMKLWMFDPMMEKFAELIINECVSIVNNLDQYEGPGDCRTAEYIKEHFGVSNG